MHIYIYMCIHVCIYMCVCYIYAYIYIYIYSRGVEGRKAGLGSFGKTNSGGERERVRGEEERGEREGEK